jgi:hypothetical protein
MGRGLGLLRKTQGGSNSFRVTQAEQEQLLRPFPWSNNIFQKNFLIAQAPGNQVLFELNGVAVVHISNPESKAAINCKSNFLSVVIIDDELYEQTTRPVLLLATRNQLADNGISQKQFIALAARLAGLRQKGWRLSFLLDKADIEVGGRLYNPLDGLNYFEFDIPIDELNSKKLERVKVALDKIDDVPPNTGKGISKELEELRKASEMVSPMQKDPRWNVLEQAALANPAVKGEMVSAVTEKALHLLDLEPQRSITSAIVHANDDFLHSNM